MFFPAAGSSAFSVGSCSTVSGFVVSVSVISGCAVSVVVFNSGVVVSTFVSGSFCSSELSFGISNPIKTITISQNHHFFHIFLEGFTPPPRTFVRFVVFCHRLRLLYCFSVLYLLLCHLSFAFNVIFSIAGFSVNFSVHTISNISLRSLTLIIETI